MLNWFTFVHNCPGNFKPFGETDAFVVWVRNVKWSSTLTWVVEGPTVVFLLGYRKQEIFPNTFQISKSKRRKKGISSFYQIKDLLKLFYEGAQNVLHTLTAVSDHCWEIREVLLLKTSPHFQLTQLFVCACKSPLPSVPAFLSAPVGFISWCLQSVTPGANCKDLARWTVLRFLRNWKEWPPSVLVFFFVFFFHTPLSGQLLWHLT